MSDNAGSALVAAEIDPDLGETPELDLFAEPVTQGGKVKAAGLPRGPGRPAGSGNKRTERALAWLRAKYPDARERLLAVGTASPHDLAHLWGCSVFEAVQEQRLCLGLVLPFVAQKQPLSVDLNTKTAVYLTIDLGDGKTQTSQLVDVSPRVVDIEEIQGDSSDEADKV